MSKSQREREFEYWIVENTNAKKSGKKYSAAIRKVSEDMFIYGVDEKDLYQSNDIQNLEKNINSILENQSFIKIDKEKHHVMYSKALKHYLNFMKSKINNLREFSDLEIDTDKNIDNNEYSEGHEKLITHKKYERNMKLVRDAKNKFKNEHNGKLYCEICNFDFSKCYGQIGESFIEAHHKKPISHMKTSDTTKIEDLAMVCSNCHRMLHRKQPWLEISELRKIINNNQNKA